MCDYWLSRCEGFVVRAGGRTVGVVEAVEATDPPGRAHELLVRRRRRRVVVSVEQVLAVVPGRKELLARRKPGALRPRLRAAYATAKPVVVALAGAVWLLLRTLAVRSARDAVALVRAAGDGIRDHRRKRDRLLAAGRRWRHEASPRLERLSRRLPRRREPRRPAVAGTQHAVGGAELANAYVFALRHDRVEDGRRPAVEQP